MLLPVDLRDWVAGDDMAHFILEAVQLVDLTQFQTNVRGCGSAQFPPQMMLALLIYCYSHGIFGSRRIEAATHQHLSVRYVAGNTHPDHDTICKFRRENLEAIAACFLRVLELAKELGLLRVGAVAIDGTRLHAQASKHRNVGYARAGELIEQLQVDIADLLKKAEAADTSPQEKETLPKELTRRQTLLEKLTAARAALEQRARDRAQAQMPAYEAKVEAQAQRRRGGRVAQPPSSTPGPQEQINLTDPESRLMRKNCRAPYEQSYNAQAAVCADGSQLIVGVRVSQSASDKGQLEPTLAAIADVYGTPTCLLADNGFLNGEAISRIMERGIEVYCPCAAEAAVAQRRYDFRPPEQRSESPRAVTDPQLQAMQEKLASAEGRAVYRRRQCSVEPTFGIIKHVLGFRQFLLRGHAKVSGEWQLVALAYNCKRLCRLRADRRRGQPSPAQPNCSLPMRKRRLRQQKLMLQSKSSAILATHSRLRSFRSLS